MKQLFFLFFAILILSDQFIFPQNFEYRLEESSAISWNGINIFDARQLGAGDISFFASNSFKGISNPALILNKNESSLGLSFSAISFDSFQYKGINEGVKTSATPLTGSYYNLNSFAGSFKFSVFKINIGWFVSDILRFPSFEFRNEYNFDQYDYYKGVFSGKKNNFFSSVSFNINQNLRLGVKLDYISGKRDVTLTNHSSYYYTVNGNSLLIDKYTENIETNKISQLIPTIGLSYKIDPDLLLSIALVYPIQGNVKREIQRSFANNTLNINMTNIENVSDPYYSPKKMIFGIKKELYLKSNKKIRKLSIAIESKLIFWSDYKYILFDENIDRQMKNSFVTGLGLELGIYSNKKDIFFRAGFKIDPQPLKSINTTLKVLSGGFGIRLGRLSGDIGTAYWFGNIGGIQRENLIICSTINYSFGSK